MTYVLPLQKEWRNITFLKQRKHTGQMKHDSQNILGCVRLSDLAKTLSNKLDLRIGEKIITLSNLSIYYTWKQKVHIITTNLKYRHQHAIINLNYLMDCILYQIFRIILSIFKKKTRRRY